MRPSDQQELYRVRFVSNDDRRSDISGNSSSASTLIKDSITGSTKSGTSQLRKFTAGIGRPGQAREAREAVRNVISAQSSSRRVVAAEPLDYEKFVIEKAVLLENDPQRELLMFPRDDVEEVVEPKESSTVVPMVHPQDAEGLSWLLPRDFVNDIYSPKRSISFNYAKFGGDYDSVLDEPPETEEMSSSLVFESDMIAEEERVAAENAPTTDVIKEGFVIVLSDTGLLDNFKPGKRRYCTVKQLISGEVAVDIRKSRDTPPKRPQLIVGSAQLRSRRRGRTAIEIEPARSSQEKSEARSLTLAFDDSEDLSNWFLSIQRALSFGAKGDTLSLGSFQPDDSYGRTNEPDSSSIGSADSGRESLLWRGQRAVAKALQPPIVDRKNIFSLYSSLSPSTKPVCEPLSILSCGSSSKPVQEHAEVITVQFIIEFKKLDLKLDVGASSPVQMIFTTHCSPKDLWLVCCVDRMLSLDYTGDLYMK
ncbi:unnamed protein product [Heligmosomoides polygyrus]|uniref:PH domain-containing protein n=1 Tax=Heligmosomoides polygyrus TaxID=6339 RepID=A0A183GQW4_HELPZ|nr:unnamed protein product [Heligmosomoides polygyrus]